MVKKITFYYQFSLFPSKSRYFYFFFWKTKWIFTLDDIRHCAGNFATNNFYLISPISGDNLAWFRRNLRNTIACGFPIGVVENSYYGQNPADAANLVSTMLKSRIVPVSFAIISNIPNQDFWVRPGPLESYYETSSEGAFGQSQVVPSMEHVCPNIKESEAMRFKKKTASGNVPSGW